MLRKYPPLRSSQSPAQTYWGNIVSARRAWRRLPAALLVMALLAGGALLWFNAPPASAQTPPVPDNVASVSITHNGDSLSVSWPAAQHATHYMVMYRAEGGSWRYATSNHTGTSITIGGVDGDKVYKVAASAYNSSGQSDWVHSAKVIAAPVGLVVSKSEGVVTLSWSPISAATGYQYRRTTGGVASDFTNVPGTNSGFTLSGLDLSQAHTFEVYALHHGARSVASRSATLQPGPNSPATGKPAMGNSGAAQIGGTLTAEKGTIADANGLTGLKLTAGRDNTAAYQWLRVDADDTETAISGATSQSYTIPASGLGKRFKVRVGFTDDGGYSESRTSDPTSVAIPSPPATSFSGLAVTYGPTTINCTGEPYPGFDCYIWRGANSLEAVGLVENLGSCVAGDLEYGWYQSATAGTGPPTTTRSGSVLQRDDGSFLMSFSGHRGWAFYPLAYCKAGTSYSDPLRLGSGVVIAGEESSPRNFTATAGDRRARLKWENRRDASRGWEYRMKKLPGWRYMYNIGCDTEGWSDNWTDVPGGGAARSVVVTGLAANHVGNSYCFQTRAKHFGLTSYSLLVTPVANRPATGAPAIDDTTPHIDERLTATKGAIADPDGVTDLKLTDGDDNTATYQWIRVDTDNTESNIAGATSLTYTVVSDDVGKKLKVRVSFSDDGGNPESRTSDPTGVVGVPTPAKPAGLRLEATGEAVRLRWNGAGQENVAQWQFRYVHPNSSYGAWETMTDRSGTQTDYTATIHEPHKAHTFVVRGVNASGTAGPPSDEVTIKAAPTLPHISDAGDGKDQLQWNAVPEAVSYEYRIKPGSAAWSAENHPWTSAGNGTSHTFARASHSEPVLQMRAKFAGGETGLHTRETIAGTLTEQARHFVETEIINGEWGKANAWLPQTWKVMKREDTLHVSPNAGLMAVTFWWGGDRYYISRLLVNPWHIRNSGPYAFEMARIFTIDARMTGGANEPMAMGWLYFNHLYDEATQDGAHCGSSSWDHFSDALRASVQGSFNSYYWSLCPGLPPMLDPEVQAVVRSVGAGETPAWFTENFQDAEGEWKLEEIWTAVKRHTNQQARFHFSNSFGGYCSSQNAMAWMQSSSSVTNPWVDGGCVPESPAITGSAPGAGQIQVSWDAPEGHGGAPINGYQVQYKKTDQENWGIKNIEDTTSYTIARLTGGATYQVRVLARNELGESTPSAVASVAVAEDDPATAAIPAGRDVTVRHVVGESAACLAVNAGSVHNGRAVGVAACDGSDRQKWTLERRESGVRVGEYRLVSALGDRPMCLDNRGIFADSDRVQIWECIGDGHSSVANLTFDLSPAGDGYEVIFSNGSNTSRMWTARTAESATAAVEQKSDATGASVRWRIAPVNETPTFTSAATFRVAENGTTVGTVVATDGDSADSVTGYTLTGGADQGKFSITGDGALTFQAAPDFESPADADSNNQYLVVVTATSGADSRALTATQTITVTVQDANEAPAFTSNAAKSVAENQTSVLTVAAADEDAAETTVTFAIQGGVDQGKFSITSAGVLTFQAAPDFENPGDVASTTPANDAGNNQYVVTVRATSGTGDRLLTADQTLVITVADVDETPDPVTGITVTHNGNNLTVSWNASAGATGYDVTYTNAADNSTGRGAWDHTGTTLTITCDVRAGHENQNCVNGDDPFRVGVRAKNTHGESAWRNSPNISP